MAKRYNVPLVAVCSKDRLRLVPHKNGGYIVNLQDSTDGGGTHWVALWLDGSTATYFDPFGIAPPTQIARYMRPMKLVLRSNRQIQNVASGWCGEYCIEFLRHVSRHERQPCGCGLEGFLRLWSKDPEDNLRRLKKYLGLK